MGSPFFILTNKFKNPSIIPQNRTVFVYSKLALPSGFPPLLLSLQQQIMNVQLSTIFKGKAKISLSIFLFYFLFSFSINAQIEVTSGNDAPYNPQNLIEEILQGNGIEIVSIDYDGNENAVGYFNRGNANIGLEEGIVLTTGVSASSPANFGVAETGASEASTHNQSTATDADITTLAEGETIFNIAKYTISFVPASDRLSFRYVFASEEYPEFGCTPYSDIFGFFISGPGFSGMYENGAENIALIPGTNLPVTINNIHPANPLDPTCPPELVQHFNDNNGSSEFPIYDGFLNVFTAEAEVVPCQEYTIKLVIADIGDAQRDSGVFFEAKSFSSQEVKVVAQTNSPEKIISEDCDDASFILSLSQARPADYIIPFNMIGTATNGVDYEMIPQNTITIPAGQTEFILPITPIADTANEGQETIGIELEWSDCEIETAFIYLIDPVLEPIDLGEDVSICIGESVDLDGTASVQSSDSQTFSSDPSTIIIPDPLTGSNAPIAAVKEIEVSGVFPDELSAGKIESVCVNILHNNVQDVDIYLYSPSGQFILLSDDNGSNGDNYTNTCFSPDATESITFGQPNAPFSAAPFTGSFQPEGTWEDLWFDDSSINGIWRIVVFDDAPVFQGFLEGCSITFKPDYLVEYAWSPTESLSCSDCPNPTATPTETTTYTLTVTDSYGCEESDDIEVEIIEEYAAPQVSCTNVSVSEITFIWDEVPNAEGYQVSVNDGPWISPNNGDTAHSLTGLLLDEMVSIEVRGTGPCFGIIGTGMCETLDCSTLNINASTDEPSCAGGSDGILTLVANGGTAPHTYTFNGESNMTGTFIGVPAGFHDVTITDAIGCAQTVTLPMFDPDPITSSIQVINNLDCENETGSASASGNGGEGVLSYQWSNDDVGNILTAETPGMYYVTVSDNNCEVIDSIEIIATGALIANAEGSTICANETSGTITVTITEGAGPFDYQWSSNAGIQSGAMATNLAADIYEVTITAADNCERILSAEVLTYSEMSLTVNGMDASCGGGADGTATVIVNGGLSDFTYLWSDAANQNTAMAINLDAGLYFVTVTDGNNCEVVDSIQISSAGTLAVTSEGSTICSGDNNGIISLTLTEGTEPIDYQWSANAGMQNGAEAIGLSVGIYETTVTDGDGCEKILSTEVLSHPEMILELTSTEESCGSQTNGTASVTVSGGSSNFTYLWSDEAAQNAATANNLSAGVYTVTIMDSNACVASDDIEVVAGEGLTATVLGNTICTGENNGTVSLTILTGTEPINYQWSANAGVQTGATAENLLPDTYTVTATDANNCEQILSAEVLATPEMTLSVSTTDADCGVAPNGTATVSIMGGGSDFTYLWSDLNGQTTATATGLNGGNYTVTVTDGNNCTAEIDAVVSLPSQMAIEEITFTPLTCHDGENATASVNVSGGTGSFTYLWSDDEMQTTATAENLTPGTYMVTITDEENCVVTASTTIENPEAIELFFNVTDVPCANDDEGAIDLIVINGVEPFDYQWDNAATTEDLENVSAGDYAVVVIDDNGCSATGNAIISSNSELEIDFTLLEVSCYDYSDGAIETNVTGSISPYTYQWSNGATTANISNLNAGNYDLTVTDANGCEKITNTELLQPELFVIEAELTPPLCAGDANGSITFTAIGGNPDYQYSTDGIIYSENNTIQNLAAQHYDLYIMDANGCVAENLNTYLSEPEVIIVDAGEDITLEFGETADLEVLYAGGTGEIELQWQVGEDTDLSCLDCPEPTLSTTENDQLIISLTDENGCTITEDILVMLDKDYELYIPNVFTPNADGTNDLFKPFGRVPVQINNMQIFDRWGNLIYENSGFTTAEEIGWNGKAKGQPVDLGVFVYSIEAVFADGEVVLFSGDVTVL